MARFFLLAASLFLPWLVGQSSDSKPADPRLRRPIALLLADNGKRLLVANRDSGTIAVLDTAKLRVVAETKIGRKLSDMAANPSGNLIFVTDEETAELVCLAHKQDTLREVRRWRTGLSPVSVRIAGDGNLATVACLWPRRLLIFDLAAMADDSKRPEPSVVDLPFAPRRQLVVPGTAKLIVADAFAGKLAVVDLRRKALDSVRDLGVNNIRGLGLDSAGKSVWLAHQVLHGQGHTTAGDIRTGNLLTNNVRRLSLAAVVDPLADVHARDQLYSLGDVERGAGDPAEVVESSGGQLLVALAGVNELAVGRPEFGIWTRLAVGRRPTALVVDAVSPRAYVANTFADSITVVDWQTVKVLSEVRLGSKLRPEELRPDERGEMLFFDAGLSFEAWFSCHSCHSDGHTSGRLNDNFSDGSFGTPKRVLSLLGAKDTGPWAWNGRMPDLETQVRNSLKSTMQGPTPAPDQVRDLTAFVQTLPPPPGLLQARRSIDPEALQRGRKVFARQKCATCHAPPAYTSPKAYDVGLRDEVGGSQFNPPSLRGLSQGGPYFHDNRALTLEDVMVRFNHQLADRLPEQELKDLLYFLGSL